MEDRISTYKQARLVLNFGERGEGSTRCALMLTKTTRGVADVRMVIHWDGPPMPVNPTAEDVIEMIDAFCRAHMLT